MSVSPFVRRLTSRKGKPRGQRRPAWIRPVPEALEDRTLLALLLVNSDKDDNTRNAVLTLREAILVSNGQLSVSHLMDDEQARVVGDPLDSGPNLIMFNIGGGGAQTIRVQSESLPTITRKLIIQGASQPGPGARPLITLAGQDAGQALWPGNHRRRQHGPGPENQWIPA